MHAKASLNYSYSINNKLDYISSSNRVFKFIIYEHIIDHSYH